MDRRPAHAALRRPRGGCADAKAPVGWPITTRIQRKCRHAGPAGPAARGKPPGNYGDLACRIPTPRWRGGRAAELSCAVRDRQPLAEFVRPLLAICDLQRPRERSRPSCWRVRPRPGRAGFASTRRGLRRAQAVVGGREVLEAIFAFETVNGPGYGAVRLLREEDGAGARLDDFDLARFRCHLRRARGGRRDIPCQGFCRPGLARAAAGVRHLRRSRSRCADRRRRPCRHFGGGRKPGASG